MIDTLSHLRSPMTLFSRQRCQLNYHQPRVRLSSSFLSDLLTTDRAKIDAADCRLLGLKPPSVVASKPLLRVHHPQSPVPNKCSKLLRVCHHCSHKVMINRAHKSRSVAGARSSHRLKVDLNRLNSSNHLRHLYPDGDLSLAARLSSPIVIRWIQYADHSVRIFETRAMKMIRPALHGNRVVPGSGMKISSHR